jgi:NhaP-type Na+/H+ or K+/H+ antiporter
VRAVVHTAGRTRSAERGTLRVISRTAVGLALPGVLLTAFIVALAVAPVFGVAFTVALMIGAVLAATDPAILILRYYGAGDRS